MVDALRHRFRAKAWSALNNFTGNLYAGLRAMPRRLRILPLISLFSSFEIFILYKVSSPNSVLVLRTYAPSVIKAILFRNCSFRRVFTRLPYLSFKEVL